MGIHIKYIIDYRTEIMSDDGLRLVSHGFYYNHQYLDELDVGCCEEDRMNKSSNNSGEKNISFTMKKVQNEATLWKEEIGMTEEHLDNSAMVNYTLFKDTDDAYQCLRTDRWNRRFDDLGDDLCEVDGLTWDDVGCCEEDGLNAQSPSYRVNGCSTYMDREYL